MADTKGGDYKAAISYILKVFLGETVQFAIKLVEVKSKNYKFLINLEKILKIPIT